MSLLDNNPLVTSYNGVSFPTETETTEILSQPVYDSAGRTVIYIAYTITLKAIIATANQTINATTDATLQSLRVLLEQPGGAFAYQNVGFGNLVVNTGDGVFDVVWGPKPKVLRWKPMGQIAAEILWTVEVRIPECPATAQYQFALMEFCFRLAFDVDQSGYTTRTYQGHVCIPQTRATVNTRTLTDTVDAYREKIVPAFIPGFRRLPGSFDLSEDKCRLDFNIRDVQVGPNYPPNGVIEVAMDQTVSTDRAFGCRWTVTINATYEIALGTARSVAFKYFTDMLEDRRNKAIAVKFQPPTGGKASANFAIPRNFKMSEPEIYGRKSASFSATYLILAALKDIVAASGLWTSVPNSDWNQWSASLANTAFSPRGAAGLRHLANEEMILDLCAQPTMQFAVTGLAPQPVDRVLSTIKSPLPDPDVSWMDYKCFLRVYSEDDVAELKPLPSTPIPSFILTTQQPDGLTPISGTVNTPTASKGGGGGGTGNIPTASKGDGGSVPTPIMATMAAYAPSATIAPTIIQTRSTSRWYAVLWGQAIRAGYPIVPPALAAVANQPATPKSVPGDGFQQGIVASWFGLPVYAGSWCYHYILPDVPVGDIDVPSSPMQGY